MQEVRNTSGIDIDPRAVQIAALALWMRAQRAYSDFGIARGDRPSISKTNIIVAEPMPGEKELRQELLASLDKQLGQLLQRIFEKMEYAGEVGALLKIEEEIPTAIREVYGQHGELFQKTDEERWRETEQRSLEALRDYAERVEQVQNRRIYQRRLFAEDAARGFAFIDLCRQLYDIAVMNPPFGESPRTVFEYLTGAASNSRRDLLTAFVTITQSRLCKLGTLGAITKREPLFTRAYENWRNENFLGFSKLRLLVDLGGRVLDSATVETAAYVIQNSNVKQLSLCFSGLKEAQLASAVKSIHKKEAQDGVNLVDLSLFKTIPGVPLAYDIDKSVLKCFQKLKPLAPDWGRTAQGASTTDDFRFCRLYFEVSRKNLNLYSRDIWGKNDIWVPFVKGEPAVPYFGDVTVVLKWGNNGAEVKEYNRMRYGSASRNITNENEYGQPGIVFPRRTAIIPAHSLATSSFFDVNGTV